MYIFTHIPKTAGTTLKFILRNNFGKRHIDSMKTGRSPFTEEDMRFAHKIFRQPAAITGHNLIDPLAHFAKPGDRLITMLRDPVERSASHYQDAVTRSDLRMKFQDWITLKENRNLSVRIIAGSPDLEKAKKILSDHYFFVGIKERFSESVILFGTITDEQLNLFYQKRIVAPDNTIKDQLIKDETTLKLLKEANELDSELYNFALEEIFLPSIKEKMIDKKPVDLNTGKFNRQRFASSKRYNKFIYRQMIKILRK